MFKTGIERTLAALNFQPTDRLPIVGGRIRQIEFLTEMAGVSLETFWRDPRRHSIEVAARLGADTL